MPVEVRWLRPDALDDGAMLALHASLDASERARAERFADARDRAAFVAAHGLLRARLGARLDRDPAALVFERTPSGRLVLVNEYAAFSLAHTRGLAVCAVAPDGPLGVDAEPLATALPESAVLALACTPAERKHLAALEPRAAARTFTELWTLKEAVAKALGVGLALPFDRIACAFEPTRFDALLDGDAARSLATSLHAAGTDVVIALARDATSVAPVDAREALRSDEGSRATW